jgi:hypothetical protein
MKFELVGCVVRSIPSAPIKMHAMIENFVLICMPLVNNNSPTIKASYTPLINSKKKYYRQLTGSQHHKVNTLFQAISANTEAGQLFSNHPYLEVLK